MRPTKSVVLTALLALGVVATFLLSPAPAPLAAQASGEGSLACRQSADRLNTVLDDSYTSTDAELEETLADIRATRERFGEEVALCAASIAMNEAFIYSLLPGRMRDSDDVLRHVRERYFDVMPANERVKYHLNRGYALSQLGQTQASTIHYVEAAALSDEISPADAARGLFYAALTFNEVGDPSRASAYLREAEDLARANIDSAGVQKILGEIEVERAILYQKAALASPAPDSLHDQAIATAEQALALLIGDDSQAPERAMAHVVIARAQIRRGQLREGAQTLNTSRPLAELAERYAPYIGAEWWLTEGELNDARGQTDAARADYNRAIQIARNDQLPATAIQGLLALANTSERQGDMADAEERYREAIDLGETIRQRLGLQDWSLAASDQITEPSQRLAALLAREGRVEDAFQILDASRARRLMDLRASTNARRDLSRETQVEVDSLLDALDAVRLDIPDAQRAERSALDVSAARIQRQIADVSGVTLQPFVSLDLGALQDTLGVRQQVLVSYLLGQEESWAFVMRPDTLVAIPLPAASAPEVAEGIRSIGVMWQDTDARGGADGLLSTETVVVDPAFRMEALTDLYQRLVAPLEEHLGDDESLLIVPGSQLATLPFGMLVRPAASGGKASGDYAAADYLIRDHAIGTELAAALIVAPARERASGGGLVYGRSAFTDRVELPFVKAEAKRVGRTLPSPVLRLDGKATEADLVARLPSAEVVHIASHATADPDFPLYSQIALADDPDDPDDGTLHLYELQNEPLAARLVVLSGCSTARGRALRGEGMMGLQYAVRAAGASSSLATLWPVDDRATVDVMGSFYEHLARGLSKDRALQQAQLDYLDSHAGIEASPFYWAPAVLSGNTAMVPWRSGPGFGLWGVLLAALAMATGVAWWLTHRRTVRV